jgi:hypothetical protein
MDTLTYFREVVARESFRVGREQRAVARGRQVLGLLELVGAAERRAGVLVAADDLFLLVWGEVSERVEDLDPADDEERSAEEFRLRCG